MTAFKVFCISVLSMAAFSCASPIHKQRLIAPEALPYVLRFERLVDNYGHDIEHINMQVVFGHVLPDAAATCQRLSTGQNLVTLDAEYWSYLDEGQKTQLVWHELGHCWLHQEHRDGAHEWAYKSIMNSSGFYPGMFEAFEAYYVQELFAR